MTTPRLCWRHRVRLYVFAFGSLLDLTGRVYAARSKEVMSDARKCADCWFD